MDKDKYKKEEINKMMDEIFGNIDKVSELSVEEQAKCVDAVVIKYANDDAFLNDQFYKFKNDNMDYAEWNSTSIGNVAYVSLYTKRDDVRLIAKQILDGYQKWRADNKK